LEQINNKNGASEKLKACLEELHHEKERYRELEDTFKKE
jgi:hypothetical protein